MTEKRINLIKKSLEFLNPVKIDIKDQGHLHVGHAGAKSGGHFDLLIVSQEFEGKTHVERHKIIYQALDILMKTEIHALSIKALSPSEV
tara:strand:- start:310 stop:576 length:267 start_codon:yes stop_codon:yes gene_type:complete